MEPNPIPDEVRRFILMNGLTVPDLEALLILRESGTPAHQSASLAARLYVSQDHAGKLLKKLQRLGAVEMGEDGAVYRPRTAQLDAIVDALLACYSRHLVQVSRLIHSAELPSPETQSAQAFADAFRIRKEP